MSHISHLIAEIPVIIRVDSYTPAHPGSWDEPPSDSDIEYTLLDEHGNPNVWLDQYVEDMDLHAEICGVIEADRESYLADAKLEAAIERFEMQHGMEW